MSNLHVSNRKRTIEACSGGLFVFSGYDAMQLSGDMAAPFLQEATFWWLTGIEEPGWKLIIDSARSGRAILYRPERSDIQMVFDGSYTTERALEISGAQEVRSSKVFESDLRQFRRYHTLVKTVKATDHQDFVHNPAMADLAKLLDRIFLTSEDCSRLIDGLRAIKQPEEIRRIRAAVKHTVAAFKYVRESLDSIRHEYGVEAEFGYAFRRNGLDHAYRPIVASGSNACTLHYDKNNASLAKNKGVLIDIGARYDGYAADITRTYCVNPTKRFKAVHAAVERAHHRCIALLGPDLPVIEYVTAVDEVMKDALEEVGLLKDRSDTESYRKYFPHSISHGLGVDTHDPFGNHRYFRPGMVITVEPGIYIPEESLGVRIEDDILITDSGHENISGALSTKL